jgi:signal transduction histidine kinase
MARGVHIPAQAAFEPDGIDRIAGGAVELTPRWSGAWVDAAAAAVIAWLALDAYRQVELGIADAGLWFIVAAGTVAVLAAAAVGRRREQRRMAALMFLWLFAATVSDVGLVWTSALATTITFLAVGLQGPTYAHMTLAYPSGRLRERRELAFLVVAYAAGLLWMAPPALFTRPAPLAPSLLFTGHTFDITPIARVFWSISVALGAVFVVLVVGRIRRSPKGARRTLLPLALAAVFACVHFAGERIAWLTQWSPSQPVFDWLDRADTLILPVAIFIGLETIRRHRGPLGDLVVALSSAGPGRVRDALARFVGDASLELGLWLEDERRFVNEDGLPVSVENLAPGRAVTLVGPAEQPLAAMIHEAASTGQQPLLDAAGAAARLALDNARLQADLRAQLLQLQASRARIVTAGDAERRRLERDLHDGAQQRLLALGLALQLLANDGESPELLAEAQSELQAALRELRELARGIHPAILTDNGLAAAIGSAIDRTPLPVTSLVPDGRYPQPVESAAYFVVCEALSNITKHAHARSAAVTVQAENGRLIVEVSDDGCGGAHDGSGGGLQGLADRVGALDGRLTVRSEQGAGTTIRAEIPCVS